MAWVEFEDLLEKETSKIKSQINAAQDAIDRVDYIRLLLAGGDAQRGDQKIQDVTAAVAGLLSEINAAERRSRENQLTLESLLAAPDGVALDYTLESGNKLIGDNLKFEDFVEAVVGDSRFTPPGRPILTRVETQIIDRVESLWSEVEETDVQAEEAVIAELEPQRADLESPRVEDQVAALRDLNPSALQALVPPKFQTEEAAKQVTAWEEYKDRPALREVEPTADERPAPPARPRRDAPAAVGTVTRSPNDPRPLFAPAEQQREVFRQQMAGGGRSPGTFPEPTELTQDEQFQALTDAGMSIPEAYNLVYGDSGDTSGQLPRPTLAETQAADRAEVEEFLRTQFGGFEFFWDKHASELQVGLTADGKITTTDDKDATSVRNVLDVIVEKGLTDPSRIEGALKNTEWWRTNDAQARAFDATYNSLTDVERLEYVEPTMDLIREELQFLGAEMSDADRQELAADLMRLGDESDTETVRDMLIQRLGQVGETFDPGARTTSDFAAARDEIEQLSRRYFVPIDTAAAGKFAEEIYLGLRSATEMEQYFKQHALSKFPTLENAIKEGFTPEEYFAPYKYEIEKMLGRPNINLYDEFADVIEYFPDVGGDKPRPMTLHEVRRYVRGLPEWQESAQGTDSARALAFAIGKTFGEVA